MADPQVTIGFSMVSVLKWSSMTWMIWGNPHPGAAFLDALYGHGVLEFIVGLPWATLTMIQLVMNGISELFFLFPQL